MNSYRYYGHLCPVSSIITTDATLTTLISIPMSSNETKAIRGSVVGRDGTLTSQLVSFLYAGAILISGSPLALIGVPIINQLSNKKLTANVQINLDSVNSAVLIQVQGVIGETWNWNGTCFYIYV